MRDEADYQGLADAAMIRAKADWLIGMNASRAYSLVYNARFTVGRGQHHPRQPRHRSLHRARPAMRRDIG